MADEQTPTAQSMDNSLAINTNLGLQSASHDQSTIQQQNNAQQNEIVQSLLETRRQTVAQFEERQRQTVAQFEQRMVQENQMFQNTMQMILTNADAANARQAGLQTQQQSNDGSATKQEQTYAHQEAQKDRAATSAEHAVDMGVVTVIP